MKSDSPFEVYIRIRPVISQENSMRAIALKDPCEYSSEVTLIDPHSNLKKEFSYDGVFPERFSNKEVFLKSLEKNIPHLVEGFNTTCFAYGSTGSGKTHTMFGHDQNMTTGIAYLSIEHTLRQFKNSLKKLSFLEIYNETVVDILSSKQRPLNIIEDPVKGIIVPDLLEIELNGIEDVHECLLKGNKNRSKAATLVNEYSSRSHTVLQLSIEYTTATETLLSKLCLIDLAGSEKAAYTDHKGIRQKEGANINKSLLALGNCINILSDSRKKGAYIPYRDSKLTRLLKDSLGGNSKTIMIACISPLQSAYEDILHTLKYASRAKSITNICTKVVKKTNFIEVINCLKEEIEVLKMKLNKDNAVTVMPVLDNIDYQELSQKIVNNFEEQWELKQSIQEIDELNEENKKSIETTADICKKHCLLKNIQENEEKKRFILQALYDNKKERNIIQNSVSQIKDDKKREFFELQIQVRVLKLEKIDLVVQRNNFRQKAEEAEKENVRKEQIISQMKAKIEKMQNKLTKKRSLPELSCGASGTPKLGSNSGAYLMKGNGSRTPLQVARDFHKRNKSSALEQETMNFINNYSPINIEVAEEGKANAQINIIRPKNIGQNKRDNMSIFKKGTFSQLHSVKNSRCLSVEREKSSLKNTPKFGDRLERDFGKKLAFRKKDQNALPKSNPIHKKKLSEQIFKHNKY